MVLSIIPVTCMRLIFPFSRVLRALQTERIFARSLRDGYCYLFVGLSNILDSQRDKKDSGDKKERGRIGMELDLRR